MSGGGIRVTLAQQRADLEGSGKASRGTLEGTPWSATLQMKAAGPGEHHSLPGQHVGDAGAHLQRVCAPRLEEAIAGGSQE